MKDPLDDLHGVPMMFWQIYPVILYRNLDFSHTGPNISCCIESYSSSPATKMKLIDAIRCLEKLMLYGSRCYWNILLQMVGISGDFFEKWVDPLSKSSTDAEILLE